MMTVESFEPRKYGVELDRQQFANLVVTDFRSEIGDLLMVNEFLLHPAAAIRFCNSFRLRHHFGRVADDLILRTLVQRYRGLW